MTRSARPENGSHARLSVIPYVLLPSYASASSGLPSAHGSSPEHRVPQQGASAAGTGDINHPSWRPCSLFLAYRVRPNYLGPRAHHSYTLRAMSAYHRGGHVEVWRRVVLWAVDGAVVLVLVPDTPGRGPEYCTRAWGGCVIFSEVDGAKRVDMCHFE